MSPYNRITTNPAVMNGQPVIRGLRITVSLVLNLMEKGMADAEILNEYPALEIEDLDQCRQYATENNIKKPGS